GKGVAWLDDVSLEEITSAELTARRRQAIVAELPVYDLDRFSGPDPQILEVGMVATDIVCLHVSEGVIRFGKYEPYVPRPGDEIREKDRKRELIRDGKVVGLIGGKEGALYLRTPDEYTGRPLAIRAAHDVQAYTLTVDGKPVAVTDVYFKVKPFGYAQGRYGKDYFLFLKTDKPLPQQATCVLQFDRKINLEPPKVSWKNDATSLYSEAVHVSHTGFRPDDPAKAAFLSIWLGTGGPYTGYCEGMPFDVIDTETGRSVFQGTTTLRKRHDESSFGFHARGRNFPNTDVYLLDFSSLKRPGKYVVSVGGIGCSRPFVIAEDACDTPLRTSLRGFFHQRSGMAFEPPYADYSRPRDFHPDDGNVFYELSISQWEFADKLGDGNLHELTKYATDRVVPNAYGGLHDAGDYDRRVYHLDCTRKMLELYELFPAYFASLRLPIPEADDDVPDIVDEALWNLWLYRRIQREDGAVRGGVETPGHPKPGECAFTDSYPKYVFAPDPRASWTYASTAARAAVVLRMLDKVEEADGWAKSALAAMEWAEREYLSNRPKYESYKRWSKAKDDRNLAALELYRLTGDPKWHDLFRETCGFVDSDTVFKPGKHEQLDAAFLYARMDAALTDPDIRRHALAGITAHAESQIDFADRQAFQWTAPDAGRPIIVGTLSTPQGQSLCRAHYLTGSPRYLEWAVRTTQFSTGANPDNMTYTTGLGYRSPQYPLFVDFYVMGLEKPPTGLTLYAHLDPKFLSSDWGFVWITGKHMLPKQDQWPLLEMFCDVYHWPMVDEFTVHQTMGPALYVWGYLAARDRR
ncbi:MAG: hypothetical protein D6741_15080, partial [Planctomycetota bacterium]